MSGKPSMPGDGIASIEEYEAGPGTFDDGDRVRSCFVGTTELDGASRMASTAPLKEVPVPDAGDIVVGTVAIVMSSMFAVAIKRINGRKVTSGVECVCSTKNMRKKLVALADDIVKLKIISRLNGTIHASISERDLGVLFTKCRKCGSAVVAVRGGIKCAECGWLDDREMSSDFGLSGQCI